MFIPNNYCYMRKQLDGYSATGDQMYGPKKRIPMGLVRFDLKVDISTVRADASATRGNVKEFHASGRILVPVSVNPKTGDLFIIEGEYFKAGEIEPRYNILGKLDHYEIDTIREAKDS